jgi:hypothetical protein
MDSREVGRRGELTLAGEGVDNALLDSLFAFREALVLTDSCSHNHTEPIPQSVPTVLGVNVT